MLPAIGTDPTTTHRPTLRHRPGYSRSPMGRKSTSMHTPVRYSARRRTNQKAAPEILGMHIAREDGAAFPESKSLRACLFVIALFLAAGCITPGTAIAADGAV